MPQIRHDIDPTVYWDGETFQAYSFAEEIADRYPVATSRDNDTIYLHDGRRWDRHGEKELRKEVRAILRDTASREIVNEVVRNVKALTRQPRDEIFDLPAERLVVRNGVVDLYTGEFTRFENLAEQPGARTYLDVEHDGGAVPNRFNDFLFDVLPRDDVSTMWELIGYCLYRGYPFQKAALFLGDGANGKSTLVKALREFLGEGNVATVELQDLARDRFAAAELEGKLANLAADISADGLERTGKFKELTGGDLIRAQRKYEEPFKFENHATLIFSANQPPAADDGTFAYERRWLYFDFPNTFTGEDAVPQRDLLEQFRQEHSGILNVAVERFRQLWARGGFEATTFEREHDAAHDRATNPAVEFAQDHMERTDGEVLRVDTAETAFRDWCEDVGRTTQGRAALKRAVRHVLDAPAVGKDPTDKRYDAWLDVRLVDASGSATNSQRTL